MIPKRKISWKQKFNAWLDEPDSYADELHSKKMFRKKGIKVRINGGQDE